MIKIKFDWSGDQIRSVEVSGHANYAPAGQDIVCAAVSSQIISVENSLHKLIGIKPMTQVDEDQGGYVKVILPDIEDDGQAHDAQLLLSHLHLAYQILADNYPEYIHLQNSRKAIGGA